MPNFCGWDGDVLVLNVLGQPSAGADVIGQPKGRQLHISVTPAPVAGRATDHMVRFLADAFDVAVGDIEVVFGRYHVNKQLRIRAPRRLPPVIAQHLAEFASASPPQASANR
ncbi:DUF167 domain-containing protein [Hydrogenophaga soli]